MEKLKRKRGAKRSRFSLVANTLRRMLGENNNNNITSMFLESLKKNLNDLQRLDRAIQGLLAAEDERVVVVDREKSDIYRRIYEQLCADYRKRYKKRDSKLKSDKSASEKTQVLSELRSDTTPESTLPTNGCHKPAGDISECSPHSSIGPRPPSPGIALSPANKSWDQVVDQIEAMEDSLRPELVGERRPGAGSARGAHRHSVRSHLRAISLTRLLVALATLDDAGPERLPARDWRRVHRALAAPPLGADRVYVIKNSFLLPRALQPLRATLDAVRRHDVERCSAARAAEGAAQRLERWRRAHRDYCAGRARGSLLLLQRRWHELRLLARAWALAGSGAAGAAGASGEAARLLRDLCRTFPHVVHEEPPRWQELRRAGELDLDPDDNGCSDYSDEEEGNLVIDEGPLEVSAGEEAGRASSSVEGDDVIEKLHQIDPAQTRTTLIFDSDAEMDLKDVDTSPGEGRAERVERAGECSDAPRPAPRARDRLVFEEDDGAGGRGPGGGGGTSGEVKSEPSEVNSEPIEVKSEPSKVKSEPSEVTSEGEVGERVGSGGVKIAEPTRVAMDSKLMMEARVSLVRVDELPAWGERARGETLRLGGPRWRRDPREAVLKASSSRREGSPKGKCEQLLSVCRPVSVLLERLPLDVAEGVGGGCGAGCRCAGGAGGRVVLPQLGQVLARRQRLLTAQVAPLVRDRGIGTTPAPGGESGECADDRSSTLWHAFDLDPEKTYEPEAMLERTRCPAAREARWLRLRGAELLRRQHSRLLAYLRRHRLLEGEEAARGGEAGDGPLTPGENVEDKVKKDDSKKKNIPPPTRGQNPTNPPGHKKRNKKEALKMKVRPATEARYPPKDKVNPAPEAKHPPKNGISEYERWMDERNRGSLMYGFKPRKERARRSSEPSEPARKKTLLNSHETVATDTDKAAEGGSGGETVERGGGGEKRGFLRVVPLASLQGPSPEAREREEARTETIVNPCDEFGEEGQGTPSSLPSLGDSLIHHSQIVMQPIVSHFNVFFESVASHHESPATQIPIGQILIPQNPVPESSIPQNPVPQSCIPRNSVPQNSIPQNPVPQSFIPQNPLPQSSIPQNPIAQSSIAQNRNIVNVLIPARVVRAPAVRPPTSQYSSQNSVPQRSIPQNSVPQCSIPQNPVPLRSIPQNSVPQTSIPRYPEPQKSIPQKPIRPSRISQNRNVVKVVISRRPARAPAARPPTSRYLISQNSIHQSSKPQNPVPQSFIPLYPVLQSSIPQNPLPQSFIRQNPVSQSSIPQNPVTQSFIPQNPVPQSSIPQNPVPQSSIPRNPLPQSSIPQNPVPQSSIPQNPELQSSRPQNRVPQSFIPQNPVPQSSIPRNPLPQSSIPQNPVPQSSIPQNPVPQSSRPQNPVPQSFIPHNPVPQSSIPRNPLPQSSIPQNPVPQSSIPQNPVPPSRITQNRNVVHVLIPRRAARAPAARPPTSHDHSDKAPKPLDSAANSPKVQAPIPPGRVYSVTHCSKDQSAINQIYIARGNLAHIPVTQAPGAQYRKMGPPQDPYHRPLAPRPLPETTLSTTTPLVTGNSTPFVSPAPVGGTPPPAAQPPWLPATRVLPLTEKNLSLHNRIFSKSRNT